MSDFSHLDTDFRDLVLAMVQTCDSGSIIQTGVQEFILEVS